MAGFGWSYLIVTESADRQVWRTSDSTSFTSEREMLAELGVTGWELVWMKESKGSLMYYFKRPRA
jgi:hypothetical protein